MIHDDHYHPINRNNKEYFIKNQLTCTASLRSVSDKACKIQTNSESSRIFSSIFAFSVALCDEASKVQ
jgi:hypothetical protein